MNGTFRMRRALPGESVPAGESLQTKIQRIMNNQALTTRQLVSNQTFLLFSAG